ncbi:MAG TPA: ABC transporter substrate-binding protein [Natronosporangium sp.]|jgi:ABC-type branched-subunit amino acid transport system substrate-binding protein
MRRVVSVGVAAVAVVLALAACRAGGGGGEGGDGDVKFDVGVTLEPCENAVNEDNGCIYLGILTDLTGPFAGFGGPLTAAQEAFWQRVNEMGGIRAEGVDQAFDVDVTTYNENTGYDATEHSRLYEEMKPNILALAQTLGSPTTAAILPDLEANDIVAVPAAYNSSYNFEEVILESPANYCVEAMNGVDYAVEEYGVESVMAVHFPNDYGLDAAGGVMRAAEANGLEFTAVPTPPGGDQQAEAIGRILSEQPDLVFLTVGPVEAATIIGGAAAQGYTGRFIGSNPTYNAALLSSDAGEAVQALYQVSTPFPNWATDSPGHRALREAVGTPSDLNDGYTIGWIWQYPLKAALEAALANGDLTRAGVRAAAASLTSVDYEGMLPEGAGNFAGGPEAQLRQTLIANPDPNAPTGVSEARGFFVGPTAQAWEPEVCYEAME